MADELGPQAVQPVARPATALIKKGLIYSSERGLIAFTVPHFGQFLRIAARVGTRRPHARTRYRYLVRGLESPR